MDRRTHKIKVSTILLWLAMSVQLIIGQTGCAPDEQTYSHFEHVTNQVWHHDMPIRFMPTWNDSTTVRDLWLTVRHTQEYPYGNLPIVVGMGLDDFFRSIIHFSANLYGLVVNF